MLCGPVSITEETSLRINEREKIAYWEEQERLGCSFDQSHEHILALSHTVRYWPDWPRRGTSPNTSAYTKLTRIEVENQNSSDYKLINWASCMPEANQ